MTSRPQPVLNPENNLNETFNANAFKRNNEYATLADLSDYGNLYYPNFWTSNNSFASITASTINNISETAFAYITYIPNIIREITNISYDSDLHITTISETTQMIDTNITDNLNVGQNINCDQIVNTKLINQMVSTNILSCNSLKINDNKFYDVGCIVYVNNLSMPIIKSILISKFNIQTINTMYITVKQGYRIDFTDIDNNVLFSYTNTDDNYAYNIEVPYNQNMINICLYNTMNNLIE